MAKQSGLGDNLYVAQYNLSGDIGSVDGVAGGNTPLDVTGIDKSAHERIGGIRDGSLEFMSFFNDAAGQAVPVLKALPTADVIATYARGTAVGSPAASIVAKQIGYDGTRGDDGSLTFKTSAQANGYGLQWGQLLTAGVRSDSTATNGASIDTAASVSFGAQAFLHVFSFTGTSVTIKIQDSADNSAWADLTGGGFTLVAGATSERIATSPTQAVRRYLRVITTGTFSAVTFAVNVVKNETAVVF